MPIRITAKTQGFRRCGVPHPATPTIYQDGEFTDEQLGILKAEPNLVVELIADEPAPDDQAGKKPGKKDKMGTGAE